jgi:hypothetical protein
MHRSGTSALTEVLVQAGAWFGAPELAIASSEQNLRGFFERTDVRKLTDEALSEQRCSWHDLHLFNAKWESSAASRLKSLFKESVAADFNEHPVSVVKDPRLCLLMPLFGETLPDPVAVYITREPAEVAMSLYERNRLPRTLGIALWEIYNRHALAAMTHMPWVRVHYADLVSKPESTILTLIEALQSIGVEGLDAAKATSGDIMNPALRRQRVAASDTRRLSTGEQFALWKRLSGPELELNLFGEVHLSRGAREVFAWHHALSNSAGVLPYLSRLSFPNAQPVD